MLTRKREWFALTAGMLLALTGMSKLISAGGNARILDIGDPVFQLPFRHLLLLVGALELLIAWQCLFRQERLFSVWPETRVFERGQCVSGGRRTSGG